MKIIINKPKSIMMCLLRKKNITVHGSYNSYILLKSVTFDISTRYMHAKFFTFSAIRNSVCKKTNLKYKKLRKFKTAPKDIQKMKHTSSIFIQVGSQSWPNRMHTTRSSSDNIAWSTCHPLCKCGNIYFPKTFKINKTLKINKAKMRKNVHCTRARLKKC